MLSLILLLNLILLQTAAATGGAAYLNEGGAKYIGLALLIAGVGLAIYLRCRKVEKAMDSLHDKANAKIADLRKKRK